MKKYKSLNDVKTIQMQVYFMMVAQNGSWLWDATYPVNQDEEFCKNFIKQFYTIFEHDDAQVVEHINLEYDDIIAYKATQNN